MKDRVAHPPAALRHQPCCQGTLAAGAWSSRNALLETTGRRTGQPRLTPICDGQNGNTFWVVTQRGRRSDYVRNIEHNPRVRVRMRTGPRTEWLAGTAHIVDSDDPEERRRTIARDDFWRRIFVQGSGAMTTSPLTIRIDLEPRCSMMRTSA